MTRRVNWITLLLLVLSASIGRAAKPPGATPTPEPLPTPCPCAELFTKIELRVECQRRDQVAERCPKYPAGQGGSGREVVGIVARYTEEWEGHLIGEALPWNNGIAGCISSIQWDLSSLGELGGGFPNAPELAIVSTLQEGELLRPSVTFVWECVGVQSIGGPQGGAGNAVIAFQNRFWTDVGKISLLEKTYADTTTAFTGTTNWDPALGRYICPDGSCFCPANLIETTPTAAPGYCSSALVHIDIDGLSYDVQGNLHLVGQSFLQLLNPYSQGSFDPQNGDPPIETCDSFGNPLKSIFYWETIDVSRGIGLTTHAFPVDQSIPVGKYVEDPLETDPGYNVPPLSVPGPGPIVTLTRTVKVAQVGIKNWIYSPYGRQVLEVAPENLESPVPLVVGAEYGPLEAIPATSASTSGELARVRITCPALPGFYRDFTSTTAQSNPDLSVGSGKVIANWDGWLYQDGSEQNPREMVPKDSYYLLEVRLTFEDRQYRDDGETQCASPTASGPFTYRMTEQSLLEKILQNWPPAAPTVAELEGIDEDQSLIDPNIDPVHLSTGEFYLPEVDIKIPGVGFDFVWARHYRSRLNVTSDMGHGWDYSYNVSLTPIKNASNQTIAVLLKDGAASNSYYAKHGTGSTAVFRSGGTNFEITETGTGYELKFSDGGKWVFSSDGKLIRTVHRSESDTAKMEFFYGQGGLLDHIVDTVGRYIAIEHDENDLITSVKVYGTDSPSGAPVRSVSYGYFGLDEADGPPGRLKSVTRSAILNYDSGTPDNLVTSYTYSISDDEDLNGNLLTIRDAKGQLILANDYYSTLAQVPRTGQTSPGHYGGDVWDRRHLYFDRIKGQQWGNVSATDPHPIFVTYERGTYDEGTFKLDPSNLFSLPPGNPPPLLFTRTRLTDREGHVKEYIYDVSNHAVQKREYTGKLTYSSSEVPQEKLIRYPEENTPNKVRASDPDYFEQRIAWTTASQIRHMIYPESATGVGSGRIEVYLYNSDYPEFQTGDRFRNNLLRKIYLPAGSPEATEYISRYYGSAQDAPKSAVDYIWSLAPSNTPVLDDFSDANTTGEFYSYLNAGGSCSCGSRVEFAVDQDGMQRRYVYDDHGNLIFIIYPKGAYDPPSTVQYYIVERFEYDEFGRTTHHHLPAKYTGQLDLHDMQLALTATSILSGDLEVLRTDRYDYYENDITVEPGAGLLQSVTVDFGTGRKNLTTTLAYDAAGVLKKVTRPKGNFTDSEFNTLGWPLKVFTSPVITGDDTRYENRLRYDPNGNVIEIEQSNITVAEDGSLLDLAPWENDPTDKLQLLSTYEYDKLNNPVSAAYRYVDPLTNSPPGGQGIPAFAIDYDRNHQPILYKSPLAVLETEQDNEVKVQYDERGLVYRVVSAPGNSSLSLVTQYDYDAEGKLRYVYTGSASSIPATARKSEIVYDSNGRFLRARNAMGTYREVVRQANRNLIDLIFVFGDRDEDVEAGAAGGSEAYLAQTNLYYDALNRVRRTDRAHLSYSTPSTYPYQNQTPNQVATIHYDYTPDSLLRTIIDDHGFVTEFEYDSARRLQSVTDELFNSIAYEYDENSNVTLVTSTETSQVPGEGDVVTSSRLEYDNLDRLIAIYDGWVDGNPPTYDDYAKYYYDSRGNVVLTESRGIRLAHADFDQANRPYRITKNLVRPTDGSVSPQPVWQSAAETILRYDVNHRLTQVTDPNGNSTQYTYDQRDRPKVVTYADNSSAEVLSYSIYGEPLVVRDSNGTEVTNQYDRLGRLRRSDAPSLASEVSQQTNFEEFIYDGMSRLRYAKNGSGSSHQSTVQSTAHFEYNGLSNVRRESLHFSDMSGNPSLSGGEVVENFYDDMGNRAALNYPSNAWLHQSWIYEQRDELYRIRWEWSNNGWIGECQFIAENRYRGPGGLLRQRDMRDFTRMDQTFDAIGRPLTTTHSRGFAYGWPNCTYAPSNLPTTPQTFDSVTSSWASHLRQTRDRAANGALPARGAAFAYDSMDRLYKSTVNSNPPTVYHLDGAQNRTNVAEASYTDVYTPRTINAAGQYQNTDPLNQYEEVNAETQQYDANGNQTIRRLPGDQTLLEYDFRNRLVRASRNAVGPPFDAEYKYDALGRLIERADLTNSIRVQYRYDGWRLIEERDPDQSGAASMLKLYFYGSDDPDDVVMMRRWDYHGDPAPQDYFYHKDDMGNILALTNSDGEVVEYYEYTDFGEPTIFDASGNVLAESAYGNTLLWAARPWDADARLYNFRHRWYDPALGRFLTRDPIGLFGDPLNNGNGYTFAGNSPYSYIDPYGLSILSGKDTRNCPTILDAYSPYDINNNGIFRSDATAIDRIDATASMILSGAMDEIDAQVAFMGSLVQSPGETMRNTALTLFSRMDGAIWEIAYGMDSAMPWGTTESGLLPYVTRSIQDDLATTTPNQWLKRIGGLSFAATEGLIAEAMVGRLAGGGAGGVECATRTIPSPGGRLGDTLTRQTTANVTRDLETRGFMVSTEVQFIRGPLGSRTRYADLVGVKPETGESFIINIGRQTRSGIPIMRERKAFDDIIFSPTIRDYPNSRLLFIEKGAPGLPPGL